MYQGYLKKLFCSIIFLSRSKSWSGSGSHFKIYYQKVTFYISRVPSKLDLLSYFFCQDQTLDQDQDRDITLKLISKKLYFIYYTTKFVLFSAHNFLPGSESWSGSGYHFEIYYEKYLSYVL